MDNPARPLIELKKNHDFLVGIDSDGCVFDTMEIKQKECFTPNTIYYWNMQCVSKYARETVEFVNLYSKWRGINRFPALVEVMDFLAERECVQRRGYKPPDITPLRDWMKRETKLGNPALKAEAERTGDPVLKQALEWSVAVNETIGRIVFGVPPFPYVRESLEEMRGQAEIIVVSQTPGEALEREWREHDVARFAQVIAGQEMGTKTEHLRYAIGDRYARDHVLMIGDAPGDLKAAKANQVLFFPINPGDEETSWQLFHREALGKFFAGEYAGAYEQALIDEFEEYLPVTPPWKR
jgi:phosphoglycolate phosphatase-like HAD superfamily hydrolase